MVQHVPRKRFGQNFLADQQVIQDILLAISPAPDDAIVEIGPGLGALTRPLLAAVRHLHAVEIDRDIIARLASEFSSERLTIHEGDALRFDFSAIAPRFRVVGNLPYNISTPLLFHLADFSEHIIDLHVMLQREVVDRMVARPGSSDYGRLSVMLQYRFQMEMLLEVPPDAFHPAPKVQSAVARMIPHRMLPHKASDEALLGRIVAAGFGQRRKVIRNTLREFLHSPDFDALGLSPLQRAEELSVEDFVRISNYASVARPA